MPRNREQPKRQTIYDLARIAKVSPGTVSRVLNNKDRVKPETRKHILSLARKIGLKPHVRVRRHEIAIVTEASFRDRISGYAGTMSSHLAFALARRNMAILQPPDSIERLAETFIDGIFAITFLPPLLKTLEQLEKTVPVVYIDLFGELGNHYVVRSNHEESGYLAARHFLERGRRNLAFLSRDNPPSQERLKGYVRAMREQGHPVREELLLLQAEGTPTRPTLERLMELKADALFSPGTSMQAVEVLHLLQYAMKRRVPEDIAVIGGESEGVSECLIPPLTTIAEPAREMAEIAAEFMEKLVTRRPVEQRVITLPVQLLKRVSGG